VKRIGCNTVANSEQGELALQEKGACRRCKERAVEGAEVLCASCSAAEALANQKFNRMLCSPIFLLYALSTAIAFALLCIYAGLGYSVLFLSLAIPLPIGLMILAAIKK
jgi:hypothetical protein